MPFSTIKFDDSQDAQTLGFKVHSHSPIFVLFVGWDLTPWPVFVSVYKED